MLAFLSLFLALTLSLSFLLFLWWISQTHTTIINNYCFMCKYMGEIVQRQCNAHQFCCCCFGCGGIFVVVIRFSRWRWRPRAKRCVCCIELNNLPQSVRFGFCNKNATYHDKWPSYARICRMKEADNGVMCVCKRDRGRCGEWVICMCICIQDMAFASDIFMSICAERFYGDHSFSTDTCVHFIYYVSTVLLFNIFSWLLLTLSHLFYSLLSFTEYFPSSWLLLLLHFFCYAVF